MYRGSNFVFFAALHCSLLGFNAFIASLLCRDGKQVIKSKAGAAKKTKLLPLLMSGVTFHFTLNFEIPITARLFVNTVSNNCMADGKCQSSKLFHTALPIKYNISIVQMFHLILDQFISHYITTHYTSPFLLCTLQILNLQ